MCLIISPNRWCPCGGTSDPIRAESTEESCSSAIRVAMSIASIAICILSTTLFLATDSIIALGVTVALGIATICLWPKRGGGAPLSTPLYQVHHAFEAAIPRPTIYPVPAFRAYPAPERFGPPSYYPDPPIVAYAPPETRVHVGGGGRFAGPAAPPMMAAHVREAHHGEEDRIPVGGHERAAPRYHPPAMVGGGLEPRLAPLPVVHPPIIAPAAEEQRIPVGRRGHVEIGAPLTSGDDRVPVGRGSHR